MNVRPRLQPRMILIGVLALAVIFAAVFLIGRELQSRSAGVHTEKASGSSAAEAADITGRYQLLAYSVNEAVYDRESIEAMGYDDWYLQFLADGTGVASIYADGPRSFRYSDGILFFSDGTNLPYRFEDGHVILDGSATLIFGQASAAAAPPSSTDQIVIPSAWNGLLEISNHKGRGSLSNGQMEVWGIIGAAEDGRTYFELYDVESYTIEDIPILSFWMEAEEDHIVPLIGNEDGWIFDRWLRQSDTIPLTLYLSDGTITGSYSYKNGTESCRIRFTLSPYGS